MAWLFKQAGSQNWWIGYRLNGKQYRRSTGATDKAQAEQELAKLNLINQAHKSGSLTEEFFRLISNKQGSAETLRGHLGLWLAECKDLSPRTLEKYKAGMEEFCQHVNAAENAPLLRDIQPDAIRAFLRQKRAATSTATAKLYRKVLVAFFNFAVGNQVLQISPVPSSKSLKLSKGSERIRRAFTLAELKTLYEKAPTEFWRYMVIAGFYMGQRMGDLISLPWGAVDFERGLIRMTARKTGTRLEIPIRKELGALLAGLKSKAGTVKPADAIWPEQAEKYAQNGSGLFSNEFYDSVLLPAGLVPPRAKHPKKGEAPKTGRKVNDVSFHCLRHTFVSLLKVTGGSQAVAKELAGHSSDAVSDLYTHVPIEALVKAVEQLPEVTK